MLAFFMPPILENTRLRDPIVISRAIVRFRRASQFFGRLAPDLGPLHSLPFLAGLRTNTFGVLRKIPRYSHLQRPLPASDDYERKTRTHNISL